MKKLLLLLILVFSPIIQAQDIKSAEKKYEDLRQSLTVERRLVGKVVGVADGDTITILDADKQQYKIRFEGIDAPESKQDFGQKAKQNLSDLVFGKTVTVVTSKVDKYKRFVGKVLLDGKDINLEQIKAGLAWHYKKYSDEQNPADRTLYASEETKARNAKLGLWADESPTAPWDWRAGVDNANLEGVPPGAIIGNRNSMVYHTPGCSTYAKVGKDTRVIFKTAEEAERAGYRIAGNCGRSPVSGSSSTNPSNNKEKTDRTYIRGSRGGCYYINSNGKKTYVDRSLCN